MDWIGRLLVLVLIFARFVVVPIGALFSATAALVSTSRAIKSLGRLHIKISEDPPSGAEVVLLVLIAASIGWLLFQDSWWFVALLFLPFGLSMLVGIVAKYRYSTRSGIYDSGLVKDGKHMPWKHFMGWERIPNGALKFYHRDGTQLDLQPAHIYIPVEPLLEEVGLLHYAADGAGDE